MDFNSTTSHSFKYITGAQNAWDMLSEEQSQKHISTGSSDLNGILGGGIHCKEVTEIGVPS
jgi:RAD51-like protein 2